MGQISTGAELPLKSRSTLFVERYARAENENVRMLGIVILLSGLLVILLIAFAYSGTRPRAVYYIPGATGSGMAYPDKVPLTSVRSFATAWLMGWMNYTPDTVGGVYTRSLKLMAPGLLAQVHAGAAEELEKVRRDRLSSVLMLTGEARAEESRGAYKVVIEGKRGIYMGKEEMSVEVVRYSIWLLPTVSTEDNPFALTVSEIRKEEVTSASE